MWDHVSKLVALAEFVALGVALVLTSVVSTPEALDDGLGDRDER